MLLWLSQGLPQVLQPPRGLIQVLGHVEQVRSASGAESAPELVGKLVLGGVRGLVGRLEKARQDLQKEGRAVTGR